MKDDMRLKSLIALTLSCFLLPSSWAQDRGRRAEVEESLQSRYRITKLGTGVLGIGGSEGAVRHAGGVVVLGKPGIYGVYRRNQMVSMAIHGERVEVLSGETKDAVPLSAGGRFYVVAVFVGDDSITVGLLSTGNVASGGQNAPVWASLNFFFDKETLAQGDTGKIYSELDQWLLPEGPGVMPPAAVAATAPVAVAAPSPTRVKAAVELLPGMMRDEIVAALGMPSREISFGNHRWMEYRELVLSLNQDKLESVDRRAELPAAVKVSSEPAGAEVYLDGNFAGSTPSTLQLQPGSYKLTVKLEGFRDWQRDLKVVAGSELNVDAKLGK
jgi:hypothetical protein